MNHPLNTYMYTYIYPLTPVFTPIYTCLYPYLPHTYSVYTAVCITSTPVCMCTYRCVCVDVCTLFTAAYAGVGQVSAPVNISLFLPPAGQKWHYGAFQVFLLDVWPPVSMPTTPSEVDQRREGGRPLLTRLFFR